MSGATLTWLLLSAFGSGTLVGWALGARWASTMLAEQVERRREVILTVVKRERT